MYLEAKRHTCVTLLDTLEASTAILKHALGNLEYAAGSRILPDFLRSLGRLDIAFVLSVNRPADVMT